MTKSERHSGRKKRPQSRPKGRNVNPQAIQDVLDALNTDTFCRQLLIEYLHSLNDKFGHLNVQHMAALAKLMGLAQIEVYETATFYSHFKILKDHETPPPSVTLRICNGPACQMAEAKTLWTDAVLAFGDQVQVVTAPCQGACDMAPSAIFGHRRVAPACTNTLNPELSQPETLSTCTIAKVPLHKNLVDLIQKSGLRGCGGAGFPTATKWGFFKDSSAPRVLVVNADEGEPGTFKDRHLFEQHMDQVLTGMILAARALEVQDVFIYLRDEYAHIHQALKSILKDLPIENFTMHLRRGAGAYICGEETALLESLEGKRGLPRHRPPFPAQSGYLGRPTLIHNVETLYWVAEIAAHGADWYQEQQRPRLYSICGRVRQPGVYRAPSTATVLELIEAADGVLDGHTFKAFLPGGASGGIFPARFADKAMDFGVFEKLGGFVGSGALLVLSDQDDLWDIARTLSLFFAHESCGQCTPCRLGTEKMVELLEDPEKNEALIRDLASVMRDTSICGLGQAAPNPVISLLDHPEDAT